MTDMPNIFETLSDADVEKLSGYNISEDELSILLNLLGLIDESNKETAFELLDLLLAGKSIVGSSVVESEESSYTQKLLGDN